MIESWHDKFSPKNFLSRVNIDKFIEHNKAYNENRVEQLERPCILCGGIQSPGLLLNDKSYLCKQCFTDVSSIKYPERYEKLHREFIQQREARSQARTAFIQNCLFRKISEGFGLIALLSIVLWFFHVAFIAGTVACYFIYQTARTAHDSKLNKWDVMYPNPLEPQLLHFHDPRAELNIRDKAILKVFNNWPGYPPFWGYLREVVLQRDVNRCQVSGCPSRVELQVHHKVPVSQGGEHVPTNLVSLCRFHHGLEPYEGHERTWGEIKTRYFTMVHDHTRRNSSSSGYHNVRAHVRRLELAGQTELSEIKKFYGFTCPSCSIGDITITVDKQNQQVVATCSNCSDSWIGKRGLTEESGPRLAEALTVTKNKGCWIPRWDMLETRADSTLRLLKNLNLKPKSNRKTIKTRESSTPTCPKCGSPMHLIKPRRGDRWKAFWGCTKYRTNDCAGSKKA